MQKPDPLIRTKLRLPFTRPGLVSRPRLQEKIAQGLCGPLTLITAPAGFGKTTLVASAIAGCGLPVAWLSLDKDDDQARRFLQYLIAALQEADHAIGGEAAQLITASPPAPAEAVLTSLINDLDSTGSEMVLVLDDYQMISGKAVHEQVSFLLEHCPNTFHLVIATRSDPPLPLSRLRARAKIVELRAADLRFTEPEAVQFLNDVMGLRLDARFVAVLEERTEGWVAGLQMAALSMRGREDVDSFIREFAGTNRFIMDFMLEEVLAREPEAVQAFLLQTAVLSRLTGPLCDAVTGASGGQEMLEGLEKRNLFVVPLDDDRRWYRYHHLFSDLLQARLNQSGPDQVSCLLSRAAEWCERDGQVAEAVSYALAARDYPRAGKLVARHWGAFTNTGEIETVWSWLTALPENMVRNSAPLSAAYCWVLWLTGQIGAIQSHLMDAERALGELDLSSATDLDSVAFTQDSHYLPSMLAALHSFVARYDGAFETAIALAEKSLNLIPENLSPQDNAMLRMLALLAAASAYDGAGDLEKAAIAYGETIRLSCIAGNATGIAITLRRAGILRLLGHLRDAYAACRDILEYAQAQRMTRLPAAGVLHVAMSEVLVEQNDLAAAEEHLSQGIELGKWSGRLDGLRNATYVLTRLRQARHDVNGALAAVQQAETALGNSQSPLTMAELLALKARILVRQGSPGEAAQCIEEAVRMAGWDRGMTGAMVALASSRVMLSQATPSEAAVRLAQSITEAEQRGWLGAAIELHILRSLALDQHNRPREAQADLERALALAEPEGYARIFLDEGQPMHGLLSQWQAHASAGPLRDYANRLLSQLDGELPAIAAEQETPSPAQNLIEPLTRRELEILCLMGAGLSNRQIAEKLFLSEGTIKFHVHSILAKLEVHSRTAALARAKELRLVP